MADTIYAAATAPGRAAVAVVRVSGSAARETVTRLAGRAPAPRRAAIRRLRTASGEILDQALVLWFPGPGSYTGEDCAEFHVHGGQAVVSALLAELDGLGLRLADPGEFTRRAFEHGKLDLAQAEGVADLIEAETDAQRRQALAQVEGVLSGAQARWREDLVEALAWFEAAVDFPDEEPPEDVADRARPILTRLIQELERAGADVARGERVRQGYRIALIGAPNAGKSTLLNALAEREAAIVTAKAGTTRDVIEVPMLLGAYKALLADTAGLRETADEIEAEGVRRARAWALTAELRLWVVDGSAPMLDAAPEELRAGDIAVITKLDLGEGIAADLAAEHGRRAGLELVRLSARDLDDVTLLRRSLGGRVADELGSGEAPTATRVRQGVLLSAAVGSLRQALTAREPELAAEDVRLAARALDKITGRIDAEAVLDRIFSTFCIGK
jgi:tRNA modification GTPase